MTSRRELALLSIVLLLFTTVAAPRAHAVNLPFTGTLRFDFAVDRAAVPFVLDGSGVAVVNGSGPGGHLTSLSLPGSIFAASGVVLPVTDVVGAFPLGQFKLTAHNGAGTVFGSGLPLAGTGFAPTVIGAPWTTGTAAVGSITRMGFAHGPASGTSSTAAASGTIQLVTPIFISTSAAFNPIFPSFATLTLHFIPEPSTLLLSASAVALLALGARRARR
jgi:hypothetical protein